MMKSWKFVVLGMSILLTLSGIGTFPANAADTASLWKLDANDDFVSAKQWGPYTGWTALSYSEQSNGSRKRLVWRHTDGRMSIWVLDANGDFVSAVPYGPYTGWTLEDYSHNGTTGHTIWNHTDGRAAIWTHDANDVFVSSKVYGPYAGWFAVCYSEQNDGSRKRLVWRHTDGRMSMWALDANGDFVSAVPYGPYAGWTLVDYWHDGTQGRTVWNHTDGRAGLWTHDASDVFVSSKVYGPYAGWSATAYHSTSGGGGASIELQELTNVLTVKKSGSGTGIVASSSQSCDVMCTALIIPYVAGQHVDLQVTPGADSVFVGWQTASGVPLEDIYYANPGDTVYAIFEQQWDE